MRPVARLSVAGRLDQASMSGTRSRPAALRAPGGPAKVHHWCGTVGRDLLLAGRRGNPGTIRSLGLSSALTTRLRPEGSIVMESRPRSCVPHHPRKEWPDSASGSEGERLAVRRG